ncbi:hypothetical protein LCGC14_0767120 [marine sediment metagenome]|uniref:site-specific DNA-methyltransferase (adenine-specific) n=1 Tax=marine sediment metagenome TaxID=412755 RepID=A0A0F9QJ82_9ZZZZ
MKFKEIISQDDIYTFFDERGILPTPEDKSLLKIDARHFLRLIIEDNLDRTIANIIKKEYSGKQEFVEHLLIVKSDFEIFIFKKLYGDPDTVIYDKQKRYASDTELSLLKKIDSLKYDETDTSDSFYELFDVREVVDKFYEEYRQLRDQMAEIIEGTPNPNFLSQIILNRIIFIYFLQAKEIIPDNYLARLCFNMDEGENYYRDYFEPIIFELFNKEAEFRDSNINEKFLNIPYLNGGLFSRFEGVEILKGEPLKIEISNDIWKKIFLLFNNYGWIIEEERGDSVSITPSVLGHIYEKSVVQRETGSYYTPKDITNYISKNTIYPYLTHKLNKRFKTKYKDVKELVDKEEYNNEELNQIYTLYFDFLKKLSVCDPACGSGAFLVAAEYVLFDLYKKCIVILKDSNDFKQEQEVIDKNSNRNYYIAREIITNNIFGVDIQEGCVEIAKLRLWLSLVSEIDIGSGQIESLPNIDYNIMVGNSLIGFTKLEKRVKRDIADWTVPKGEMDELRKLKKEFRRTKSSKRAEQIRHLISEKTEIIQEELNALYCHNNKIAIKDKITITDEMSDEEVLNQIQLMNQNHSLTKFKIKLKKKNSVNLDKVRAIDGITCYAREGKVSSIYPTPSFNFEKHKEGKRDSLSTLLLTFISKWNEVEIIEFERLINVKDLNTIGFFHWIIEFYDVFENGGFDIIIGNPPYIRQEKINDLTNGIDYKLILAEVFSKLVKNETDPINRNLDNMDLSVFFIFRSFMLLRDDGYHSFIITNKWLRAAYGLSIRRFLKYNTQIVKLIDFIKSDVFQGLTVDTVLYILRKNKFATNKISFCLPNSIDEFILNDHSYNCEQVLLEDEVWSFSDPITVELKTHIESRGKKLKDMNIKIYRGVTTGFNDAFLVKSEIKNKIITKKPELEDFFKPILKGKNITRYSINWKDNWIIRFENRLSKRLGIKNEKEFQSKMPNLFDHYKSFFKIKGKGKGLKNRDDRGEFWWELRACDYYEEFEKVKIIATKAAKEPSFALDYCNFYILNTSYAIVSESKMLLAILNSNLCRFYIQEFMSKLKYGSTGTYEPKIKELEKFPVTSSEKPFDVVDYLHINKEAFEDITNGLIYELYFKEQFYADGLYPKSENYLHKALEKYLKPIRYKEFSKLDWKQEIGKITDKEQEKLNNIIRENRYLVEELISAIDKDSEIKKWMDIIKTHRWVKKIEEKIND